MIEVALAKHLESKSAIRNLIGTGAIFRGRIKQSFEGVACIVLRRVDTTPNNDLLGESEVCEAQLDVCSIALNEHAGYRAEQVAEVIRNAIAGFRGYWDDTYVHGCTRENEVDLPGDPMDASDTRKFQYVTTYRVTFTQSAPTLA